MRSVCLKASAPLPDLRPCCMFHEDTSKVCSSGSSCHGGAHITTAACRRRHFQSRHTETVKTRLFVLTGNRVEAVKCEEAEEENGGNGRPTEGHGCCLERKGGNQRRPETVKREGGGG